MSGLRLTAGVACLVFAGVGADTLLAKGANDAAQDIAVQDYGSMVTFSGGMSKSGGTLYVRIDGPSGENVFEAKTDFGFVDWSVDSKMPSGNYKYDVWFTPMQSLNASEEQRDTESFAHEKAIEPGFQTQHKTGVFKVEGGVISPQLDPDADVGEHLSMHSHSLSPMERVAGAVLNFLVPSANAGTCATPCEVGTGEAQVTLIPSTGSSWEFETQSDGSQIRIGDNGGSTEMWRLEAGAPNVSFFMESTGDIGLGTSTPATQLELVDTFPNISLVDSDNANKDYELLNNGGIFFLIDRSTGAIPINAQNNTGGFALTVNSNNVGVGNFVSPSKLLHVQGSDASALTNNNVQLRVENTSGTVERRDLIALSNNGGVKFTMEDRDRGDIWDFSTRSNGFNINLLGTGGQELLVTPLGEFRVGPGGVQNFVVKPNGDVFVDGSLVHSSSRETKEQISTVDGGTVLAKLERLEVAEWSYKDAVDGERHLSPMAEDFHGLFGLGPDNKHVSPSDLAGVALAAAKALKADNDAKDQRIAELEARMARLEALIAD